MNLADVRAGAVPLYEAVKAFIANEVDPITEEFYRLGEGRAERWGYGEGQLELLDGGEGEGQGQRACGTSSCPNAETGEGLSNLDYAYIADRARQEPAGVGVPQLLARPTPATWRCSSGSARRSRRSSGSSRCSTARSAPPTR